MYAANNNFVVSTSHENYKHKLPSSWNFHCTKISPNHGQLPFTLQNYLNFHQCGKLKVTTGSLQWSMEYKNSPMRASGEKGETFLQAEFPAIQYIIIITCTVLQTAFTCSLSQVTHGIHMSEHSKSASVVQIGLHLASTLVCSILLDWSPQSRRNVRGGKGMLDMT